MIRLCRAQIEPLVTKIDRPRSGESPSRIRADFGKAIGCSFSTWRMSAGSLQRKEWKNGVRNSAIQAR